VECLERFVTGINAIFEADYLRRPNNQNQERLLQLAEARDFHGMLGPSIVCIGNGKIVQLRAYINIVEMMMENPQSCLKL